MRLNPEARVLLSTQRGVLADWQATRVGITPRQLRYARSTGSWRLLTPHVFAAHTVEASAAIRRQVGLLEAGPEAVLGGRSALTEAGWRDTGTRRDDDDDPVDVFQRGHEHRERDFERECRRRGLPAPVMQTRHVLHGGVRWTDAQFQLPDGRTLLVEIDGVGHMSASGWHSDIARHNALALGSRADLQLRVTGWELRHDPGPFFALIEPLFAAAA